jgi:hypothetical protein
MENNNSSNSCLVPIFIGVFVFLIALIKQDFTTALFEAILAAVVWFFIVNFFGKS